MNRDRVVRYLIGGIGIATIAYGVTRILQDPTSTKPLGLAKWLIGALLLHDLLIAPLVLGVGWIVSRVVPGRARPLVQGGLITGALISVIAVVLINREGKTSSPALALLTQNYLVNLLILLAIVAAVCGIGYASVVLRDNRRKSRSRADH